MHAAENDQRTVGAPNCAIQDQKVRAQLESSDRVELMNAAELGRDFGTGKEQVAEKLFSRSLRR
jgi:hypothetical protein